MPLGLLFQALYKRVVDSGHYRSSEISTKTISGTISLVTRTNGVPMKKGGLDNLEVDIGASVAKSIVGVIPLAGPAVSELLSHVIPNQRLDRVAKFVVELEKRISKSEQKALNTNRHFVDLFEDTVVQATRSLTEERNRYLAVFLSNNKGISEFDFSVNKKILHILEELTDKDIEILKSFRDVWYSRTCQKYCILRKTIGTVDSFTEEERYRYDLAIVSWDAHLNTLERLRLIQAKHKMPSHDPDLSPDYLDEETGIAEIEEYIISGLGKVLLTSIGE